MLVADTPSKWRWCVRRKVQNTKKMLVFLAVLNLEVPQFRRLWACFGHENGRNLVLRDCFHTKMQFYNCLAVGGGGDAMVISYVNGLRNGITIGQM